MPKCLRFHYRFYPLTRGFFSLLLLLFNYLVLNYLDLIIAQIHNYVTSFHPFLSITF